MINEEFISKILEMATMNEKNGELLSKIADMTMMNGMEDKRNNLLILGDVEKESCNLFEALQPLNPYVLDAAEIVFYKIVSYTEGMCTVNHGPGTEKVQANEKDFIEQLIQSGEKFFVWHPNGEMILNAEMKEVFGSDRVVIITNMEKIENDVNCKKLLNLIRVGDEKSSIPAIVLLPNDIDDKTLNRIRSLDGEDHFFPWLNE